MILQIWSQLGRRVKVKVQILVSNKIGELLLIRSSVLQIKRIGGMSMERILKHSILDKTEVDLKAEVLQVKMSISEERSTNHHSTLVMVHQKEKIIVSLIKFTNLMEAMEILQICLIM